MRRHSGYTLLEMIVVLAVIGLAAALVAPAGFRTIATWRLHTERDAILGQLAALPARALDSGEGLTMPAGELPTGTAGIELPEGWRLTLASPLEIRPNGACGGAGGTLEAGGRAFDFELAPPFCRPLIKAAP